MALNRLGNLVILCMKKRRPWGEALSFLFDDVLLRAPIESCLALASFLKHPRINFTGQTFRLWVPSTWCSRPTVVASQNPVFNLRRPCFVVIQ